MAYSDTIKDGIYGMVSLYEPTCYPRIEPLLSCFADLVLV